MTPDQITQLRTALNNAMVQVGSTIEWAKYPGGAEEHGNKALGFLEVALALLPCSTCNGMGIMMRCVVEKATGELVSQDPEPCLDCQPICKTCNGTKKVFKPRAMRMSQPCPDCK